MLNFTLENKTLVKHSPSASQTGPCGTLSLTGSISGLSRSPGHSFGFKLSILYFPVLMTLQSTSAKSGMMSCHIFEWVCIALSGTKIEEPQPKITALPGAPHLPFHFYCAYKKKASSSPLLLFTSYPSSSLRPPRLSTEAPPPSSSPTIWTASSPPPSRCRNPPSLRGRHRPHLEDLKTRPPDL